jgi:hypothetical protein
MNQKAINLTNLPPQVRGLDIDDQLLWLAFYRSGSGQETSTIDEARRQLVGIYTDGADAAEGILVHHIAHSLPPCPTLPHWVIVDYDAVWNRHLQFQFFHASVQNWLYLFRMDT